MIPLGNSVQLVTRSEWGARRPRSSSSLSASTSTAHWVGPGIGSSGHDRCATRVRGIQAYHMDGQGWQDIAYNLLPCPHGYVFEGRGRGRRSAANGTAAGNSGAFAVCYLGGSGDPFTAAGQRAMRAAMDYLAPGGRRNGHRDWKLTECPGGTIYAWVRDGARPPGGATPSPPKPAPPKPAPPAPDPVREDDDMTRLYKGDKSDAVYYTNLLWKRHVGTPREIAEDIWIGAVTGQPISTAPGHGPHVRPQAYIDRIPTVGAEGPRDHAIELRVIDVRNELDKITDEVRAWQAAVEAG